MSDNLLFTLWGIGGYLLGSIPFGLVLCYLAGYGDIRKIGSGNIGATNVLRTGNKWLAFKFVPAKPIMFLGTISQANIFASLIAGSMAIIGHNFPVWLKFKGGKGVASAFGFILATQPMIALSAIGVWLLMAFTFKYSSLSAITAAFAVPIITFFYSAPIYTVFFTGLALLVLIRHHANIKRLIKGEESKIKLKKKDK